MYRFTAVQIFLIISLIVAGNMARAACQVTKTHDKFGNVISDYKSANNPDKKTVLLMPPTGGENPLDRKLASALCEKGLNSVIFNYVQKPGNAEDLGTHDEATLRTLNSLNSFLETRDERFVIVGVSLGSLYASMAMGLSHLPQGDQFPEFKKIQGAVLVVCGGPLSEILATSQLKSVVAQREARFKMFGYKSVDDYQAAMDAAIAWDPLKLSTPELKDKVLMYASSTDVIIPARTQTELWEGWGEPERHIYSGSHVQTSVEVYAFKDSKILEFAQRILK